MGMPQKSGSRAQPPIVSSCAASRYPVGVPAWAGPAEAKSSRARAEPTVRAATVRRATRIRRIRGPSFGLTL